MPTTPGFPKYVPFHCWLSTPTSPSLVCGTNKRGTGSNNRKEHRMKEILLYLLPIVKSQDVPNFRFGSLQRASPERLAPNDLPENALGPVGLRFPVTCYKATNHQMPA